jgi:hypothetical protein
VSLSAPGDRHRVAELLGRPPAGSFRVVVRRADGDPVVIENGPFLDDGRPMPTRYWLVGAEEARAVSRQKKMEKKKENMIKNKEKKREVKYSKI